jgi:hypothetical protein
MNHGRVGDEMTNGNRFGERKLAGDACSVRESGAQRDALPSSRIRDALFALNVEMGKLAEHALPDFAVPLGRFELIAEA